MASPPNVDNELIEDYARNATMRLAKRNVYRVHLDVVIKQRWDDLRKLINGNEQEVKEAYYLVLDNIDEGNQSDAVKKLVATAMGLPDVPSDRSSSPYSQSAAASPKPLKRKPPPRGKGKSS